MEASSLILLTSDDKIILQLRDDKDGVYYRGCWGLIGGAAFEGESPRECMVRECIEELGWKPKYLRKVLEIQEYCQETVFVSYIEFDTTLKCNEGQQLKPFAIDEIETIHISDYHKRIIKQYKCQKINFKDLSEVKVLLYTKILPPAFGGYVSAGINLLRLFSSLANVSLVSDDNIQTVIENDNTYDILLFNATYEKSNAFCRLSEKCKQSWSFEHNELTDDYLEEMRERFRMVSRAFVPSEFLKDKISQNVKAGIFMELSVLPIPIDSQCFSFSPHVIGSPVKFVTCCALKQIRNLEFVMEIMKDLRSQGLSFQWDIYGDIPYQGDTSYLGFLQCLANQLGVADSVQFHKALTQQQEIAEVLHDSDFYIDFSKKETYGMAKIEAALSGVRMILPPEENNRIFEKVLDFYIEPHESIAKQIVKTVGWCLNNRDKDRAERRSVKDQMIQFSDAKVLDFLKKILYETV